jgi:hypothetical protein
MTSELLWADHPDSFGQSEHTIGSSELAARSCALVDNASYRSQAKDLTNWENINSHRERVDSLQPKKSDHNLVEHSITATGWCNTYSVGTLSTTRLPKLEATRQTPYNGKQLGSTQSNILL